MWIQENFRQSLCFNGYVSENQQLPAWMRVGLFLDICAPFYPTWDTQLEAQLAQRLICSSTGNSTALAWNAA